MDTTTNGLEVTFPYEATSPGVARYQCAECGGWERADKNCGVIRHSRRCASKPQPKTETTVATDNSLKTFAANVRETGLAHGRTEDLVEAVRTGHLSLDDAMNTDD
jgi:hypothetical protein